MAKNKTLETNNSVAEYLNAITDEQRRKDCKKISSIMEEASGYKPKMWGEAIVGFGSYHYKYASGHEGDAPLVGFSNRVNAITLYVCDGAGVNDELLKKFGKHKKSKACVYIQKLDDVDGAVLGKMVKNAIRQTQEKYPAAKPEPKSKQERVTRN